MIQTEISAVEMRVKLSGAIYVPWGIAGTMTYADSVAHILVEEQTK